MDAINTATNLDALFAALQSAPADLDISDLPTFGGAEPADTSCVFSWDAERMIVGDNGTDLEIVRRDER